MFNPVNTRVLQGAALCVVLLTPVAASAQAADGVNGGAAAGAATSAVGGAIVGSPVGAAVGGAAGFVTGAIVGGAAGALTADDRTYVKEYVVRERVPSVRIAEDVDVGTVLPGAVTYVQVTGRPHVDTYRYAVVNDEIVVVDPRTRKIIGLIE